MATGCGETSCAVQAHGSWYGSGRTEPGFSCFFVKVNLEHALGMGISTARFPASQSFLSLFSSLYFLTFPILFNLHQYFLFPYFLTIKFLSTSPHFMETLLAFVQIVMAFFSGCRVICNTYRLKTESHFCWGYFKGAVDEIEDQRAGRERAIGGNHSIYDVILASCCNLQVLL